MSAATLPPPSPPICLTRSYKSRGQKGGTVIAEDVHDLQTHRKRLLDPDDYRSVITSCRACGTSRLHALCFRERVLRRGFGKAQEVETVRLYRCALKPCGAVFTVLPAISSLDSFGDSGTPSSRPPLKSSTCPGLPDAAG